MKSQGRVKVKILQKIDRILTIMAKNIQIGGKFLSTFGGHRDPA